MENLFKLLMITNLRLKYRNKEFKDKEEEYIDNKDIII